MSLITIQGFSAFIDQKNAIKRQQAVGNPTKIKEIAGIADQVLAKLPNAKNELESAQAFIKNLEAINQSIKGNTPKGPFDVLLFKLNGIIKRNNPAPQPRKLNEKIALFEQFPSLKVTAKPNEKVPQQQNNSFAILHDKIKKLDLSNPKLSEKIALIKTDLQKLQQSGALTSQESGQISLALDSLYSPTSYQPCAFEKPLLDKLAKKNPALKEGMKKYADAKKRAAQEARSQMLKILKSPVDSPKKLAELIQDKCKLFESQLPKMRFAYLEVNSESFNKKFVANLPALIQGFKSFSLDIAAAQFDESWNEILAEFEKTHAGKFATLLKNYSYCNPDAQLPEFISGAQSKYLELFKLDAIDQASPEALQALIGANNTKAQKHIKEFFTNWYVTNFYEFHEWLFVNLPNIKKSYNQGEDDNHNLGKGTCSKNSLDREVMLAKNPQIPSDQILMKSSAQGRFAQSRESQIWLALHKHTSGELPLSQEKIAEYERTLQEFEVQELQKLKIKKSRTLAIPSNNPKPRAALVQALKTHQSPIQCILHLDSPKNEENGHSMNIQCNGPVYRFIDDNLGVCEYSDSQTFLTQFEAYLQAHYRNLNIFSLDFYEST